MSDTTTIPIVKPKAVDPVVEQLKKDYETKQVAGVGTPGVPVKTAYPSEVIELPSEGYFYEESSPLASGKLDIKYMTAREEDILTSQNLIKKGVVLDRLLEALIVTPNVVLDDILVCDKNAIFVAARRLAYGDNYEGKVTCTACNEESIQSINLNDLKFKEYDFSQVQKGQNLFTFELPTSKKVVTFKLLTSKEEKNIDVELKNLEKITGKGSAGKGADVTTRLKYIIQSIDGVTDRQIIKKLVDDMPARDAFALRQFIKGVTPDLDMVFNFTCPSCGHEEVRPIPIGINFFWPDATT
jgi:transcription elongation factor Elf1